MGLVILEVYLIKQTVSVHHRPYPSSIYALIQKVVVYLDLPDAGLDVLHFN